MAIDNRRQPTRLAKVLRAYLRDLQDQHGNDANEDLAIQELMADVFQWVGDWHKARKLAVKAEQSYQLRMVGIRVQSYQDYFTVITSLLPEESGLAGSFEEYKTMMGGHVYNMWQITDPHRFCDLYYKLIKDGWRTTLHVAFSATNADLGRLILRLQVRHPGVAGEQYGMVTSESIAYIERGHKRMLGIIQELCGRVEIDPPRPRKVTKPGNRERAIDLDAGGEDETTPSEEP